MWNLKYTANESIYKTDTDLQTNKNIQKKKNQKNLEVTKGESEGQIRSVGLADTITHRLDKQQGFTV